MNGASINLGPRGRLFENSVEHQQAVRSGVPCFAGFTLFQFSRKPVESEVIDSQRLKSSHGLEIRNHFRNHGTNISRIHVQGVPQLEETEVDYAETCSSSGLLPKMHTRLVSHGTT